jgi:hypothetical protein
VGGGVQLGPLGTAATNVPAPSDYDDREIGRMIGRGNQTTRRNPALKCRFRHHKSHMLPVCEPGRPSGEASD